MSIPAQRSLKRRPSILKVFTVIALITVFVIPSLSSPSPLSGVAAQPSTASSENLRLLTPESVHITRAPQPNDHVDMHHILSASYYRLEETMNASLILSNQGPHPMSVHPILFNLSGQRLDAPEAVIEGNDVQTFELREWIVDADESFRSGSLQVSYDGMDMELGGVVKLVDSMHSLIFDEELTEPAMMFASSRLEGVWQLVSNKCELEFALSNTSTSEVSATLMVEGVAPKQQQPAIFTLLPHQTRILKSEDLTGKKGGSWLGVGGISIEHSGAPGAVIARGLIQEKDKGYSSIIECSDPKIFRSSRLDGAGLRLGEVADEDLSQSAVARNLGNSSTIMKGRIVYKGADGSTGDISLPDAKLVSGEIKAINLNGAIRGVPKDAQSAALEFTYSGAPGTVIAAAESVSRSKDQVFRVPFMDATAVSSSTGNYPWSIDDTSSTFVYIKNSTNRNQEYVLQISYDGGAWMYGLKTLVPSEIMALDIRSLRDAQVKDDGGNRIPLTANHGQVHWSVHGGQNHVIVGRAEQVDFINGMSMTSACGECCPDSFYDCWMEPGSVIGRPGSTTQFAPKQRDSTCYGTPDQQIWSPYTVTGAQWSSLDPSVAIVNSSGLATAQGPGGTTIEASFQVDIWHVVPPSLGFCELERVTVTPGAACAVVVVTLSLKYGTNVQISMDNAARTAGVSCIGSADLKTLLSTGTTCGQGWRTSVEIVGTVDPSSYAGIIVLHRERVDRFVYHDMTKIAEDHNNPDDSDPSFRDDDPQSGGSGGKVYDLDGPLTGSATSDPIGRIVRRRVIYRQWATLGSNGAKVSDDFFWFHRMSVIKTSNGDQLRNDVSGDNIAGTGKTKLTWNLQ
jgi:hypothetical protein